MAAWWTALAAAIRGRTAVTVASLASAAGLDATDAGEIEPQQLERTYFWGYIPYAFAEWGHVVGG